MKATLVPQTQKPEGVPLNALAQWEFAVVVVPSDSCEIGDVLFRTSHEDIWSIRHRGFFGPTYGKCSSVRVRILQPGEQVLIEV